MTKYTNTIDIENKSKEIFGRDNVSNISITNEKLTVMINNSYFKYNVRTGKASKLQKVEYSDLKLGQLVDYPVDYQNVGSFINVSTKIPKYVPDDNYIGWRILNINKDEKKVKLVSTGVPICYYHGWNSINSVNNMTINFFNNTIEDTLKVNSFCYSGFKSSNEIISSMSGIKELFNNDLTELNNEIPNVCVLNKEEMDTAKEQLVVSDMEINSLLVKCKDDESSLYAETWYATVSGDRNLMYSR